MSDKDLVSVHNDHISVDLETVTVDVIFYDEDKINFDIIDLNFHNTKVIVCEYGNNKVATFHIKTKHPELNKCISYNKISKVIIF